jgi:tetratricopeptide (TPR) repeat protein
VRLGLRSRDEIAAFIQAVRAGEQPIQDADAREGRDRSLGASLDYGFRHAFREDELPIIALLHLFQGTVDVNVLVWMGESDYALPELAGKTFDNLTELLGCAREGGLLTSLGGPLYTVHPALPWYLRQLFTRHYDGLGGHSSAEAALRAWVEAISELSTYCHRQFNEGNRNVIQLLMLEEANLVHVHRVTRRRGWWHRIISVMQGLGELYRYQGRAAEWARLVAEITPNYCTPDDAPISGREDDYSLVMGYRVRLAHQYNHDLLAAFSLQEKLVAWSRQLAAPALVLPFTVPLDATQRNRIRTLGISIETLGHILREQGSLDCVQQYRETIVFYQRIGDTAAEAITHANLGHAYLTLPAIRDLDAAEAAYQRSLELSNPDDALGRSKCLQAIGMVHHGRFREARDRKAPTETTLRHAQTAEQHLRQALALCPPSAVADLGQMHHQLAALYVEVGQIEPAREHYERAVQYLGQARDYYNAGGVRYNIATMYRDAAGREPARRRDLLRRAAAYAAASLRDFESYQGRAADREADARRLIEIIARALGE